MLWSVFCFTQPADSPQSYPHSLYAIEFVRIPVNREQRDLKTVHVENR